MIIIHGPPNAYNESLQYVLSRELGRTCRLSHDGETLWAILERENAEQLVLVLLDGASGDYEERLRQLAERTENRKSDTTIAIYNLPRGTKVHSGTLRQGVRGVFFDEDTLSILLKGVRALLKGEVWLSHQTLLQVALDDPIVSLARVAQASGLSRREIEILAHLSRGETNDEIAQALCVSTHTVKTHLYNIYRKINVTNRFQASLWAAKHIQ